MCARRRESRTCSALSRGKWDTTLMCSFKGYDKLNEHFK